MFGLRQKLALGYLGLLGILLAVSVLAGVSLHRYRSTLERIFRENYDSVVYGQRMKAAVETLDAAALADATGNDTAEDAKTARTFQAALDAEDGNVTLPGEAELVARIRRAWQGSDADEGYLARLHAVATAGPDDAQLRVYRATVQPRTAELRDAAQGVIDLNVQNMGFANGAVQASTGEATRTLYALAAAGLAFGGAFVFLVARSIVRQLGVVTASARQIEQGNLDLIVPVTSRDEVGQLAETFNRMAARLRELRRTDRAKLVRTQRTTEQALGSLPDGVAIVAPGGRVELSNGAAQKLFGLRPGESVHDAPAGPALGELVGRATGERRAIEAKGYEGAIQIFNGQERFFLPTAVPIFDAERTLVGVTLVLADVTNLRKLDEMKSGLLSVVSHELKTPLTSMRMATHLLLEERIGSLNAKQAELLGAAKEDADRLYRIIEDLLDMGRMQSGRGGVDVAPVPPARLAREAVDEAEATFRDRGVTLRSSVEDGMPEVSVDADRVSHVFSNLLSNALKYTPAGGNVEVSAAMAGDAVEFAVRDSGKGIPADALPHVFERFYRAADQGGQRGVGLGLAIAQDIVMAHDGNIRAESLPSQGTTIRFTLPVAVPKERTP